LRDLWVAEDGSYGTSNIVLVDTGTWTDSDWERLEDAGDFERMEVAVAISESKGGEYDYA
jgi:hypothetical protein